MIGLTAKQSECLAFLKFYIGEHGVAPSLREIADVMHVQSISGVSRMLDCLEERGRIRRLEKPRGIEILTGEYLGFLTTDVRASVIEYAKANKILPETVIAERMREWAEHEAKGRAA